MPGLHEFDLIKDIDRIINRGKSNTGIALGIGDDSAVLSNKGNLLVSKDLFVEDVHFRKEYTLPEEIGYKSIAVNVSDIAAMGGKPRYILFGFCIPDDIRDKEIYGIIEGMKQASDEYDIVLIGGDISRSPKGIVISVTIIGDAVHGFITRSAARPGDSIYLTGRIGDSGAGLELLLSGKREGMLQMKHKKPKARVNEALLLAGQSIPSSMIDISDGMVADLYHILSDSKVGAEIYRDLIPVSEEIVNCRFLKHDPVEYALYGGEDYELIFTTSVHSRSNFTLQDEKKGCRHEFYYIGSITGDESKLYCIKGDKRYPVEPEGYRHF